MFFCNFQNVLKMMIPTYSQDRVKKGVVFCVNNVDREFPNTRDDVDNVKTTFSDLGFDIETPRTDLRHQELTIFVQNLKEKDFSQFNIFVLFVLSHGSSGDIISCWDSRGIGQNFP